MSAHRVCLYGSTGLLLIVGNFTTILSMVGIGRTSFSSGLAISTSYKWLTVFVSKPIVLVPLHAPSLARTHLFWTFC
ncbi:hypothetical protein GGS21DRAFT_525043 [Xylaria nigripes]|nr:hypothetical protein GGS21DRAFT_525043 [Xylaria nigripes]